MLGHSCSPHSNLYVPQKQSYGTLFTSCHTQCSPQGGFTAFVCMNNNLSHPNGHGYG